MSEFSQIVIGSLVSDILITNGDYTEQFRPMGRQIGIVANCLLCDSYFVEVVDQVDLSEFRGRKKGALEEKYEDLQVILH
jgi:hypothetical protein